MKRIDDQDERMHLIGWKYLCDWIINENRLQIRSLLGKHHYLLYY